MRNTISLLALAASLVAFTSVPAALGQDEKKDIKVSAEITAAMKKVGDPAELKDTDFSQAIGIDPATRRPAKMIATLIQSKVVKTEIHLGTRTGHLGTKDGTEVFAVRTSGSGLMCVDKRTVVFVRYDEEDGLLDPVEVTPAANPNRTWAYVPPAGKGFLIVYPRKK